MPEPLGNPGNADFLLQGAVDLGLEALEPQLAQITRMLDRIGDVLFQSIQRAQRDARLIAQPFDLAAVSAQRLTTGIEAANTSAAQLSRTFTQLRAAEAATGTATGAKQVTNAYLLQQQTLRALEAQMTRMSQLQLTRPDQVARLENLRNVYLQISRIQPADLMQNLSVLNKPFTSGLLTQSSRFKAELIESAQAMKQLATLQNEMAAAQRISGVAGISIPPEALAQLNLLITQIRSFGAVSQTTLDQVLVGWRRYITTIQEAQAAIANTVTWEEQSGAAQNAAVGKVIALRERLNLVLAQQQREMTKLAAMGPGQQLSEADIARMQAIQAKWATGAAVLAGPGTKPEDLEKLQQYKTLLTATDQELANLQLTMQLEAANERKMRAAQVEGAKITNANLAEELLLRRQLAGMINTPLAAAGGLRTMGMTEENRATLAQARKDLTDFRTQYDQIMMTPAGQAGALADLRTLESRVQAASTAVARLSGVVKEENNVAATTRSDLKQEERLRLALTDQIQRQIIATNELMGPRFRPTGTTKAALQAELDQLTAWQSMLRPGALPNIPGENIPVLEKMRAQFKGLRSDFLALRETVPPVQSVMDSLFGGFTRYIKIAAQLTLVYGGMRAVMNVGREIADIDEALSKLDAVMAQGTNRSQYLTQAYESIIEVQKRIGLSSKEAGQLVYELNKAFTDQTLAVAALKPAMALLALGETNQAETVRTLSGVYSLFGQSLDSSLTPTQKLNILTGQIIEGAKISAGSVDTLARAIQNSGGVASASGMKFSELVAVIATLQNALQRAGTSGTEVQRMVLDFQRFAGSVASVFGIKIDLDQPINAYKVLTQVLEELQKAGPLTAAQYQVLLAVFHDQRALKGILSAKDSLTELKKALKDIEAGGESAVPKTLEAISKNIRIASDALTTSFLDKFDRWLSVLQGTTPGKMEGISGAINLMTEKFNAWWTMWEHAGAGIAQFERWIGLQQMQQNRQNFGMPLTPVLGPPAPTQPTRQLINQPQRLDITGPAALNLTLPKDVLLEQNKAIDQASSKLDRFSDAKIRAAGIKALDIQLRNELTSALDLSSALERLGADQDEANRKRKDFEAIRAGIARGEALISLPSGGKAVEVPTDDPFFEKRNQMIEQYGKAANAAAVKVGKTREAIDQYQDSLKQTILRTEEQLVVQDKSLDYDKRIEEATKRLTESQARYRAELARAEPASKGEAQKQYLKSGEFQKTAEQYVKDFQAQQAAIQGRDKYNEKILDGLKAQDDAYNKAFDSFASLQTELDRLDASVLKIGIHSGRAISQLADTTGLRQVDQETGRFLEDLTARMEKWGEKALADRDTAIKILGDKAKDLGIPIDTDRVEAVNRAYQAILAQFPDLIEKQKLAWDDERIRQFSVSVSSTATQAMNTYLAQYAKMLMFAERPASKGPIDQEQLEKDRMALADMTTGAMKAEEQVRLLSGTLGLSAGALAAETKAIEFGASSFAELKAMAEGSIPPIQSVTEALDLMNKGTQGRGLDTADTQKALQEFVASLEKLRVAEDNAAALKMAGEWVTLRNQFEGAAAATQLLGADAIAASLAWTTYGKSLDQVTETQRQWILKSAQMQQVLKEQPQIIGLITLGLEAQARTIAHSNTIFDEFIGKVEAGTKALEDFNTQGERAEQATFEAIAQNARYAGDALTYVSAKFAEAGTKGTYFFDTLGNLAESTAKGMSSSLSDYFFDEMDGKVANFKTLGESMFTSLKRSAAAFMSDTAIHAFTNFFGDILKEASPGLADLFKGVMGEGKSPAAQVEKAVKPLLDAKEPLEKLRESLGLTATALQDKLITPADASKQSLTTFTSALDLATTNLKTFAQNLAAGLPSPTAPVEPIPVAPEIQPPVPTVQLDATGLTTGMQALEQAEAHLTLTVTNIADLLPQVPVTLQQSAGLMTVEFDRVAQSVQGLLTPDQNLQVSMESLKDEVARSASQLSTDLGPDISSTGDMLMGRLTPAGNSTTDAFRQLIIQIDLAAAALRNLGQGGGGAGGGGIGGDLGGAVSEVGDLVGSVKDVSQAISDFENSTEALNRSFREIGQSVADFEFDAESGLSGLEGAADMAAKILRSSSQSTSTSLLSIGKSLMPLISFGGSLIAFSGALKAGNVQGAAISGAGLITSSAKAIDEAAKIVANNAKFFGESTAAFAKDVNGFMKALSPLMTGITFATSLFGFIQNLQQGDVLGATLSGASTLMSGISLGTKIWPYIAEYASKLGGVLMDVVTIVGNGAKVLGTAFTGAVKWVTEMLFKGLGSVFETLGLQQLSGLAKLGANAEWGKLLEAIGPALKIIANVVGAAFAIYGAIMADNAIEQAMHATSAALFVAAIAMSWNGIGEVLAVIAAIVEVVDAVLNLFGVFSGPTHYQAQRIRAMKQAETGLGKLGPVYEAAAGGTPQQVLGALQTGEMDQHIRATLYLPPEIAKDLGLIAETDKTQLEWTQLNAKQFNKLIEIYSRRPELVGMVGGSGDIPYLSQEQAQNLANIVAHGAQALINTLLLERAPKEQQTPEGLDVLTRWEEQVGKLSPTQMVTQFAKDAGLDMSKLMMPAVPTPEDLHARLVAGGIDAASAVEEAYRTQYEAWAAASKEDASAQPPDLAGMLAQSGLADSIVEWIMAGLGTSQFKPDIQALLDKLGPGAGTPEYLKLFTQLNPNFAASPLGGILYGLIGNRTGITPGQGGLTETQLERIQSIIDELSSKLGRAVTGAGTTKEIRGLGGEGEKLILELNKLIWPALHYAGGISEDATRRLNEILDAAAHLITAIKDAAAKFEPSREQARAELYLPDQVSSEYVNKFLAPMQMAGGLLVASIAPLKEKIQPTVDAIAALKDRIKALQDVGVDTADLDAQLKALQAEIAPTEQQLVPLQQALDKIQKQIAEWTALIEQEGVIQADIAKLTFNQIDQLSLGAQDFGRTLQANVQDIKNNRKILDMALRGTSAADVTKAAQDTAKGIMDTYQALSNYLQGLEKQLADLFDKVGVPLVNLKIALAETELAAHGTGTQFRALVTALSAVATGARDVEVRSFAATEGIAAISAAITGIVGRITGTTLADLGGMRPEEPVAASTYSRLASSIMDAATAAIPFIRAFEEMASKSEQLGDYTAALKQLGQEQTALLGLQKSVIQGMRDLQRAVADALKDFGKPLVDLRVLVATNTMAVTGSASGFRDLINSLESTISATDNVQVKAFAAAQGLSVLGAALAAIAEMPTPVTFEDLTAGLTAVATEAGTFTSTLESLATAAENASDFQKALGYLDQERSGLIELANSAIGAIKSWETAAIEAARKAGDAQKKVYEAQKKANQDQIDALSTQLSAIKELDSAFDSVTKMISELRSGGQATPAESLIYAQAEFQRMVAAFQRATPENRTGAAQNVQDAARTLLDILKQAFTPGSNDYLRVYNQVLAGLGTVARGLQGAGAGTGDAIQAQINALEDVNKGIDDLITQVDTDTETIIAGIENQATTLITGVKNALGVALKPLGDRIGADVGLIVSGADDAYAVLVKINDAINLQLAALGIRMGGDLTKSAQALQDAIFAITGGMESQAFLALMAKLSNEYLKDIRDDLDAFLQLAGPITGRQPGQEAPKTNEAFLTALKDFTLTPDMLQSFLTATKQTIADVLKALYESGATVTAEEGSFLKAIARLLGQTINQTLLDKLLPGNLWKNPFRRPDPTTGEPQQAQTRAAPDTGAEATPGEAAPTPYETAMTASTAAVGTNTSAFEDLTDALAPTKPEFDRLYEQVGMTADGFKAMYDFITAQEIESFDAEGRLVKKAGLITALEDLRDELPLVKSEFGLLSEQVGLVAADFKRLDDILQALLSGQPIPSYDTGGLVPKTGLILAHAGEIVIPASGSSKASTMSQMVQLNIHPGAVVITGVRDAAAAADMMMTRVYREARYGQLGKEIGQRFARSRP